MKCNNLPSHLSTFCGKKAVRNGNEKSEQPQDKESDTVWVNRFQNGDGIEKKEAFEELFNRYELDIRWYLMRLTQDKKLAGDLKQETFLRTLKGLDNFRQNASFKTWLYRIATNTWRSHVNKHRPVSGNVSEDEKISEERPDDIVEMNEQKQRVCDAIDQLTEKLRAAIVLVRFEGLKYREAANALDISLSALKVRVRRANKKLRGLLTD